MKLYTLSHKYFDLETQMNSIKINFHAVYFQINTKYYFKRKVCVF